MRRYRKERSLPELHPLVDLCNAASLAFAIPIAVFDTARVVGAMTVRLAHGDEIYETFAGEIEAPGPCEVVFADDAGRAHARRWTNRQSGWSAVRSSTADALIVSEALHEAAEDDVARLISVLGDALKTAWPSSITSEVETQ